MNVVFSFQTELDAVESMLQREIRFKTFSLEDLIDLPMNNFDHYLCPAVVLAIGSMTGRNDQKMLNFASIIQYVFLAHHIHAQVTDEDMSELARQFPVLVGDFMFGMTFGKLCEDALFPYSGEFVKLIKIINEGRVMRWRLKNKTIQAKDYRLILGKEKASLTALAARLAAQIAELQEPFRKRVEDFGYFLGMAWAVWEEPLAATSLVQEYLNRAKGTMAELKDHLYIKPLQELYEFFNQEINPSTVFAVIQ